MDGTRRRCVSQRRGLQGLSALRAAGRALGTAMKLDIFTHIFPQKYYDRMRAQTPALLAEHAIIEPILVG